MANIQEYLTGFEPELRADLAAYLELVLCVGDIPAPAMLTSEEEMLAEYAARRMKMRWRQACESGYARVPLTSGT